MDEGLHRERLDAVIAALRRACAKRVADLGCGTGNLLSRLLHDEAFDSVLGLDVSAGSLDEARGYLAARCSEAQIQRLRLLHGSFLSPPDELASWEAFTLVETIEHIDPGLLGQLGDALWGRLRPQCLVVTTPNADYNALFDMPEGALRDPDHRFEWGRRRFAQWAHKLAGQYGYRVRLGGVGEEDWTLGAPTQMAVFTRTES